MIRDLTLQDISTINDLIADKNYVVNEYELNKNSKTYIKDNKIVAFISYTILFERAELNYIYVCCEYRNQHIASTLLEFMINDCHQKNVHKIDLEVSTNNNKAISLYDKYEFKIMNVRKKYYNGIDAYLMLKELR